MGGKGGGPLPLLTTLTRVEQKNHNGGHAGGECRPCPALSNRQHGGVTPYMATKSEVIDAANRRIGDAIRSLPDLDSSTFWEDAERRGALAPEVLVHLIRRFRAIARPRDVAEATDRLIAFAYPVVQGIVRRTLLSRPQDHEDAVCETIATMWRFIADTASAFWERNLLGALHAAAISVCRVYLAKKRTYATFSDLSQPGEDKHSDDCVSYMADDAAAHEEPQLLGRLAYERLIAGLDPSLRDVARLLVEDELSQREIAQRLQCTEKTVYNRIGRIRAHLTVTLVDDDKTGPVGPLSTFGPNTASRETGAVAAHEQPAATARCR